MMARIRSVKPPFLTHELLQDLEQEHGELKPMLTYLGLWLVADKAGRFPWTPRLLKLEILPFLPFRLEDTLALLQEHGFVHRYEAAGKAYGLIPTFTQHQRISGDESDRPPKYPAPPQDEAAQEHDGSDGEAGKKQTAPGQGKPKKRTRGRDIDSLQLLPPHLEAWFDAIWNEVWPEKTLRDGLWCPVNLGRKYVARERFATYCKHFSPVAIYLAARAYVRNDPKVKDGFIQEVSTFLGPKKATCRDYLEEILPYLEKHPTLAALAAPPTSEETFRQLISKDEAPHE